MIPSLQPTRPKISSPNRPPTHQQSRAIHPSPPPQTKASQTPSNYTTTAATAKPHNQLEAMPPYTQAYAPLLPPRNLYNSATRHPVFFTDKLRRLPFPMPELGSRGWSPVAEGYVLERERGAKGEARVKL